MDAPISWIREYADIPAGDREYADRMTMLGQKVERFSRASDGISGVVTGRIVSVEKHPNADRLLVCRTDAGRNVTVITGAANVKAGDIVPVALDGARLPGSRTITGGEIRGVMSEGMFCSLSELGFSLADFPEMVEDGIMILPAASPVGEDVAKLLHLDDAVFEFEITPNRPDCLSVTGLARESAAAFGVPFRFSPPAAAGGTGDIGDLLAVERRTERCLRYTAGAVRNVRVAPSPQWMRERLRKCGLRPINNIVDITNYVMLEYGQPMHAFDLKHVAGGRIVVRQAEAGETIVTLDGLERALSPDDMVIADEKNPSAVAGVMGGEWSGIYGDTETVIFESACFDRLSVRFTAKRLGLRTDSSARFEKGLDPHNTLPALRRALQLVEQLGAGEVVGGVIDLFDTLPSPAPLPLDAEAINAFLGTGLSFDFMADALRTLGFSVDGNTVTPPTFRADVEGMADLAEEVARIYGYDQIPASIMSGIATARPDSRQRFIAELKALLVGSGLFEAVTPSFMRAKSLDGIRLPKDSPFRRAVKISNPLGEETSLMRTTLLPSLMEVAARNYNVRQKSAAVFELASVYLPAEDADTIPDEPKMLAVAGYGALDYYRLKGIIEQIAAAFRIGPLRFLPSGHPSYHPTRAADVFAGDKKIAVIGEVHPAVADYYGIRERCSAAEIDAEALFSLQGSTVRFKPLPKFPAITRDLALVSDEGLPSAAMESVIRECCGDLLESLGVFDVYRGTAIGPGKKSVAYSLVLRDGERTLTDREADGLIGKALAALGEIRVFLRS